MSQNEGPWYKQFWLWFILTPLFIVMVAGFSMLYLAITTHDGVIVDNPYKDGKGFVARTLEDEFARSSQLKARLHWAENNLTLRLTGDLAPMPDALELLIVFPTSKAYDITVALQHRGLGEYTGKLSTPVSGRRQLQLQPLTDAEQSGWRLHFDGQVPPLSSYIELKPKSK